MGGSPQLADEFSRNQIAVESLESFVSQNIEEISGFDNSSIKANFTELIQLYNHRVHAVEIDKSLMIELPSNLAKGKKGCGRPASGTSHSGLLGLYVNMGFRSFSRRIIPSFLHSLKRQAPGLISVRPNVRPNVRPSSRRSLTPRSGKPCPWEKSIINVSLKQISVIPFPFLYRKTGIGVPVFGGLIAVFIT
ncbi:MAG: DUF4928 family protein [Phaeodactylibacter sp.]|nr:DUF4928 family protein [Phaeodactylibacter sp.]